jgi:hypothetical protein
MEIRKRSEALGYGTEQRAQALPSDVVGRSCFGGPRLGGLVLKRLEKKRQKEKTQVNIEHLKKTRWSWKRCEPELDR